MWSIKDLKEKAIYNVFHNYWRIVGIVLILAFLSGGLRQIHIGSNLDNAKDKIISVTKEVYEPIGRLKTESVEEIADGIFSDHKQKLYTFAMEHYKATDGYFADIYNKTFGEESFAVGILSSFNETFFQGRAGRGMLILVASIFLFFIWVFVRLPLSVGKARFMLEARSYGQTKISTILYPWRRRRWLATSRAIFTKYVYLTLWSLTIVGGIVKYFAYIMQPYILAENMDISAKESIALSEKMMMGEKWKVAKLYLSFVGWYILNFFTFGILKMAFITPYKEASLAELYIELRRIKKADFENIFIDENLDVPFAKYEVYPSDELEYRKLRKLNKFDYRKKYSLKSLILIFFTFSMLGWLWEVSLYVFGDGIFVNRGVLHGPWLPIYGTGGVMVIVLLRKLSHRPGLCFSIACVLCGLLEYFTAYGLWKLKGQIWWDYSGYFLNIHGRVCAEALMIFGLGAMAFIYILGPFFDLLFEKIPRKIAVTICVLLISVFAVDLVYSYISPNTGENITEYKYLEEERFQK